MTGDFRGDPAHPRLTNASSVSPRWRWGPKLHHSNGEDSVHELIKGGGEIKPKWSDDERYSDLLSCWDPSRRLQVLMSRTVPWGRDVHCAFLLCFALVFFFRRCAFTQCRPPRSPFAIGNKASTIGERYEITLYHSEQSLAE